MPGALLFWIISIWRVLHIYSKVFVMYNEAIKSMVVREWSIIRCYWIKYYFTKKFDNNAHVCWTLNVIMWIFATTFKWVILIWSSWSYSRENGPLRSNTSTSSSHHPKMWGVDYAIFGIIQNAMSCSITRWNVTIFWRADFVSYHFKSKSCFFITIYFHQTQSDRANRYHWTLPPLKNIVPYFICFASIIKAKEAFFNKTNEIISYNMYTVAMDTTTTPF